MKPAAIRLLAFGPIVVLLSSAPGHGQFGGPPPPPKAQPRMEAVAETKLLQNGLAHANVRGLERTLTEKPAEAQAWTFARGQQQAGRAQQDGAADDHRTGHDDLPSGTATWTSSPCTRT